jgi:hypothetical protein
MFEIIASKRCRENKMACGILKLFKTVRVTVNLRKNETVFTLAEVLRSILRKGKNVIYVGKREKKGENKKSQIFSEKLLFHFMVSAS